MFLFVHQLGSTKSLWLPQIRGILGLDEGYSDKQLLDLFTIALPGHPDDDASFGFEMTRKLIDQFVEEKFLKQQEIGKKMVLTNRQTVIQAIKSPKLIIIGHELGGAIALDYALDNISKIRRLVLVGCGASFSSTALTLKKYYFDRLAKLSTNKLQDRFNKTKDLRHKNFLFLFSENSSRQAFYSGLKIMRNFDFGKKFEKLSLDEQKQLAKLPILSIRGSRDWLCRKSSVVRLQSELDPNKEIWLLGQQKSEISLSKQEPNFTSKTYKGAGGSPMDTDPVSFVYDVRQFLNF